MVTSKTASAARHPSEGSVALVQAMREEGLTQDALGKILGASQPTVSKLIRGQVNPRPRLAKEIEAYLAGRRTDVRSAGIDAVVRAYGSSEGFRRICDAAIGMMNEKE